MNNRRSFLQRAFGLGAGLLAAPALGAASETPISHHTADPYDGPSSPSAELIKSGHRHPSGPAFNVPVVTPDVGDLPFTMEGGWKVFRLTAQVVQRQVAPNKSIDMWGFNGSCPGPTIQVNHGDQVRVIFKNELPEPTSLHWHGFEDRIGFDGMPGISQEPVKPGGSFTYEFHITQEGTYFYHSHMAMQEMAGMLGAFIMHPRTPYRPSCDKDFAILLQEFWTLPNNTVPNTMNMEFNWLLIGSATASASASSTSVWITIPCTFMATRFTSPAPKVDASPKPPGGPAIPFWLASRRRATSNLSPTIPATGCCTAIFPTT